MSVRIQTEDFDISEEIARLRASLPQVGAVVSFLGTVRDIHDNGSDMVFSMELEHYPGMTEKVLQELETEVRARWQIEDMLIIHRVGRLEPTDQIVLVVVCSRHRQTAFEACAYTMDMLKTRAPFWKKEATGKGNHWVEAKTSDEEASAGWLKISDYIVSEESFIINDGTFNYLKKRYKDIECYFNIIKTIDSTNVTTNLEFQRKFNHFYRVRRNKEWRDIFYSLMEKCKSNKNITFEYIIKEFYDKTQRVEASFSSKILASLNPSMPIFDSIVLKKLNIKSKILKNADDRMSQRISQYNCIVDFYKGFLTTEKAGKYISKFDAEFPEFKSIINTKKIDFLLWGSRSGSQ
ncbi:MAG: molybdenum cofactor biosynthesis protein MoaE [Oxalobacter sp.]|nr:molybdenum cofactor biosynthesis protein MoaE [Oxalobacter sp.]